MPDTKDLEILEPMFSILSKFEAVSMFM
jgi:hypothetical protein